VWTLALQVIVYIQMFGLGLQTVVTYYVAKHNDGSNLADQRTTVRAALALAGYFCVAAAAAVALLVALYPALFGQVPAQLLGDFRIGVALLGLSCVAQLLALVPAGVFAGLHRNIVPVGAQLTVRCLSLMALWWMLRQGAGLLALCVTLAGCGVLLVPLSFAAGKRWAGTLFARGTSLDRSRLKAMFSDCAGLAVWNVAMLLVNGVDVLIVGHFDFNKVAAFSLAATGVTIFVGVLQAVLNPLVAVGSSLGARAGGESGLQRLLVRASIYCALFLMAAIIVFLLCGNRILPYWVGPTYVTDVRAFLLVLLVAHAVRNLMAPYSVLLVAVGLQKKALLPALAEGLVNLSVSLLLAAKFGALGVAYGTLIGALAGVVASVVFVVGQTRELVASRMYFVRSVLALPLCGLTILFVFSMT
jgi:O-antigen/teichoic acid export membrane protein